MSKPSDEELYRRLRGGDKQALAELYDRLEPGLFRYALHMSGSRAVAEDVTQEVFFQLLNTGLSFDERRGTLEAYCFGVARNLLRRQVRLLPREQETELGAPQTIVEELIGHQKSAALRAALQELPPNYRDVVVLCELEERSYEDTSRLLAIPIGTVRSRLHRARLLLAAKLKPLYGVPATPVKDVS